MIVVDTNVMTYLWLPGSSTSQAEQALLKDPEWIAPLLWRSEFRNVLAGYIRRKRIPFDVALHLLEQAESHMEGGEYAVSSDRVMKLVASSPCSAYDCEFVALAQDLEVPLITTDKKVLSAFPAMTVDLKTFVRG